MHRRPLTESLPEDARFVALMRGPKTLTDHLIHGWDALAGFDRGERREQNLAHAARCHSAALGLAPAPEVAVAAACEVGNLGLAIGARTRG